MLATKTTAPTQRTSWSATALQIIAVMFVMTAMVGNRLRQIKAPRLDAYNVPAAAFEHSLHAKIGQLTLENEYEGTSHFPVTASSAKIGV